MMLSAGACGSASPSGASTAATRSDATTTLGTVAMFLPTDGFAITQNVPLNTWHDFAGAAKDSLQDRGFADDDIESHTDSDLEKQSHRIQDYVVERIDSSSADVDADVDAAAGASTDAVARATTLVVAPAAPMTDTTKRYGDYASQTLPTQDSGDGDMQETLERLTRSLTLAKKAGMHVVVVSTPVPGFTPDAFVCLSSAREIGRMQAQQLVSKLQLDATSRYNPKYVEIMLPFDEDARYPDDEEAFASEAFQGVWDVIGPYYRSGVVLSRSMTATASTADDDWRDVAFDASDADRVKDEFERRLGRPANGDGLVRIDGVIAMNDFVADGVVQSLTALGYTGSAADVNPSITIGDIVGNIAGKQDLQRQKVPDPKRGPALKTPEEITQENEKAQDRWPIVTGFGAYVSNMPNIVDGLQWSTGLSNRFQNAENLAHMCTELNERGSLDRLDFVDDQDLYGQSVPTMALPLLAASAGNLKTALIDPGYISLAEAGL